MTWLLTGGAGYIGSHVARALLKAGSDIVVVDDLSTGRATRLPAMVTLHQFDVADTSRLQQVLDEEKIEGVIHLAAKKSVAESVTDPLLYWRHNVQGFHSVLTAMSRCGVTSLVLSSSASVYGQPSSLLVAEDSELNPVNPYGDTKLACERMLYASGRAHEMNWISLRYFNVAGTAQGAPADTESQTLIPLVLRKLADGKPPIIYGNDYPTSDGTCIRDFVHVVDLADAHVVAAGRVLGGPINTSYNIGRGIGCSVKEVISAACAVAGVDIDAVILPRREGDTAQVVAAVARAHSELQWEAHLGLQDMVASEWAAMNMAGVS